MNNALGLVPSFNPHFYSQRSRRLNYPPSYSWETGTGTQLKDLALHHHPPGRRAQITRNPFTTGCRLTREWSEDHRLVVTSVLKGPPSEVQDMVFVFYARRPHHHLLRPHIQRDQRPPQPWIHSYLHCLHFTEIIQAHCFEPNNTEYNQERRKQTSLGSHPSETEFTSGDLAQGERHPFTGLVTFLKWKRKKKLFLVIF